MTRHLGVSVFLSVSIVVFFAVVLYQPEEPAARPATPTAAAEPAAVEPATTVTETHPPAGPEPPAAPTAPPVARALPVAHRPTAAPPSVAVVEARRRAPSRPPRVGPRPTGAAAARRPFIEADAGETVEDVARRVYGSPDLAHALWRANRDLVPDCDARLAVRTVLRTP